MIGEKYILYNVYAKNGKCKEEAEILEVVYENTVMIDIRKISSYEVLFGNLEEQDEVILCGGDGTLNHFVNAVQKFDIKNNIYFYSVGNGYDFVRDLGLGWGNTPDFLINPYIKKLPTLTINGKEQLFVNGVGFGLDSYCWENQEKVYKKIGEERTENQLMRIMRILKNILFYYHPVSAAVSVDDEEYTYEKVWLAPTMNGRFYNGGLMPTPEQDRIHEQNKLSLMIMHDCGRCKAFFIYLAMYKGKHEKYKKNVKILSGKEIKVTYDRPVLLQVDGEIIGNITEYHARI